MRKKVNEVKRRYMTINDLERQIMSTDIALKYSLIIGGMEVKNQKRIPQVRNARKSIY